LSPTRDCRVEAEAARNKSRYRLFGIKEKAHEQESPVRDYR
jgi:hypothetical protein